MQVFGVRPRSAKARHERLFMDANVSMETAATIETEVSLRWLLLACDWERVGITAGGNAAASDGGARFAGL